MKIEMTNKVSRDYFDKQLQAMYHYSIYDLHFASCISLPALRVEPSTPDILIRYGSIPTQLMNARAKTVLYQASQDTCLFDFEGVASYLVRKGKEIIIKPAQQSDENDICFFLLNTPFGALLHQRGFIALHGSGIGSANGAVCFLGYSGRGKSVLAAAFHRRGYPVLSDDINAVTVQSTDSLMVLPGTTQLRIYNDAAKILGNIRKSRFKIRRGIEQISVPTIKNYEKKGLQLHRIYELVYTNNHTLELEELTGFQKSEIILKHTYCRRLIESFSNKRKKKYIEQCLMVSQNTVMKRIHWPHGLVFLNELILLLEEDFAT